MDQRTNNVMENLFNPVIIGYTRKHIYEFTKNII